MQDQYTSEDHMEMVQVIIKLYCYQSEEEIGLTHFLFLLVTVKFLDHSNHLHVIFRGLVLLYVYNIKLDSFKNDKL